MLRHLAQWLAVAGSIVVLTTRVDAQQPIGPPWDSISRVFGAAANVNAGTYRYNLPRSDLHVRVGNVEVAPALALVTWAAFGAIGADSVVMGDIVVSPGELPNVLRGLSDADIDVSAIHNHLAGEEPRVMYVHYMGHGTPLELAGKVKKVFQLTPVPMPVRAAPAPVTVDTALVFGTLGARGRASGAVAQLSFNFVPQGVTQHGAPVPAPLSVASPVNVQLVSADRMVGTGDFTVSAGQVDRVLDAFAKNGITATAVHSHMIGETPALYFMHFWADGKPADVLRGLKAAIDAAKQ
jgi:predicted metal-dependent enzyme (double-stranded beta helix superfamily)